MRKKKIQTDSMATALVHHLVTVIGIVGLIAAFVVITYTPKHTFHEIEYQPRVILDKILTGVQLTGQLPLDDTAVREITYRRRLLETLPDSLCTQLLFSKQLVINPDSFSASKLLEFEFSDTTKTAVSASFLWDYYISYSLLYKKPMSYPCHLQKKVASAATAFETNIDFFSEYPCFILWLLLVALQLAMFPSFSIFALGEISHVKQYFNRKEPPLAISGKMLFCGLVIVLFIWFAYRAFFDDNLIMNGLFCRKAYIYILYFLLASLASLFGAVCFSGFLLITDAFQHMNYDVNEAMSPADFRILNRLFNRLISCVAIGLSIIVITTGALVSSLNSMEFITKVTDDFGYSPIPHHYVFLMGILSSGLILLFCFPAKLQLINVQRSKNTDTPQNLDGIVSQLKTAFTVCMPALVAGLHYIVTIFTK